MYKDKLEILISEVVWQCGANPIAQFETSNSSVKGYWPNGSGPTAFQKKAIAFELRLRGYNSRFN
jgi:hypothetical protein